MWSTRFLTLRATCWWLFFTQVLVYLAVCYQIPPIYCVTTRVIIDIIAWWLLSHRGSLVGLSRKSLEMHQVLKYLQFSPKMFIMVFDFVRFLREKCEEEKGYKGYAWTRRKSLSQFLHLWLNKAKPFPTLPTFIPMFEHSIFWPYRQHYTHRLWQRDLKSSALLTKDFWCMHGDPDTSTGLPQPLTFWVLLLGGTRSDTLEGTGVSELLPQLLYTLKLS